MSQLVSRILLAILVFPLASILYLVLFIAIEEGTRSYAYSNYRNREMLAFFMAGSITWAGVASYWWLLWRSSVKWTGGRIGGTFGAAAIAAVIGCVIGFMVSGLVSNSDNSFGIFVGSVLAILLWLIATIFLWRETAVERASRLTGAGNNAITCPTCGYNLTGLNESRCPECGSKFTLDELLAGQPSRAMDME